MLRTLIHYWRIQLAVALATAGATAVLTGALLVGDSVRGSLRDLIHDRLGGIELALTTERFLGEELATELAARSGRVVVPAILLRGAVTHADSGRRASRIGIHGIDERFAALARAPEDLDLARAEGQLYPSVVVNESLARELGARVGDALLLSFARPSLVPRETLLGDKDPDDVVGTLRLTLTQIASDRGPASFSSAASQLVPLNAFVALDRLQRALGIDMQVNALFAGDSPTSGDDLNAVLDSAVGLDDLGLVIERRPDHLQVASRELVLSDGMTRAVEQAARAIEAPSVGIQAYLANRVEARGRSLSYSMAVAFDPLGEQPWARVDLADGRPAPSLGDDELLLNAWAADDLAAEPGDTVRITYYVVGPREELREEGVDLRLMGVVAMRGLGADRSLTPDYPGIQDARDMAEWNPPFPVDLDRIRPKDEGYWDEFGSAPKLFVSAATGRALWASRFGSTTSVRLGARPGGTIADTAADLRRALLSRLDPRAFGLAFRDLKGEGLRAASGATDFAGLFVGFSMFLIVSSALLVGMLFRLGVEQRVREVGLLLAVGHPLSRVRRRLLAEGSVLALLGALLGVAGGTGYAWLMMAGLRTLWLPAVGSSALFLHVAPRSLALGWLISVAVVLVSIVLALRVVGRVPAPSLLAGSLDGARRPRRRALARLLAWVGLLLAVGLLVVAVAGGRQDSPGLAFGAAASMLVSGLAFFALWCRRTRRPTFGGGRATAVVGLAARNSSWNPGRSMLSVALVASACFVIVAVAVNREDPAAGAGGRESGTGGFSLVAESDVPLYQDLNRRGDRFDLSFSEEDSDALAGVEIYPFRLLPGDDASCLNLYRPSKPRLLGVSRRFIDRGGFRFRDTVGGHDGGADGWRLLETPLEPGVIPAIGDYNSVRWILHLALGEELSIEDAEGRPLRLRLVALLDGSLFQSELLISEADFLEHFPEHSGDSYFLIEAPQASASAVGEHLERALASFGFDATSTVEKLRAYKAVEHTYLSTFQVLGGLGLLLGTVGLAVVLVRNVIERRGELATLRAFGFRRRRLASMVLAETAFLLVAGLGIGALSALVAVAPRLTSLHVPWASLAGTLALVLAVGMLASVAAVLSALRAPLLPALKAER